MDGISTPTDSAFRLQLQRGAEALELLRALGRVGKGSRVYEVGCSSGGVLYPFLEAGCVVAGSDYDIRFLENARKLSIEVFEGGWESLRGLPAPDIVILSHVVEHLNDPVELIRSVATLLKPSGCLFVAVPGLDSIAADYCGDLLRYLQICHTFHFTRRTLMHTLRRAGLTPIHADDSVLSVSVLTTSSVVLPEETEDPEKLFSRIMSLERSFQTSEMRLHRRARALAVGFKRLLSNSS